MALEDLKSDYGPTNKKGQKGTGKNVDVFANEGEALDKVFNQSKYALSSKPGSKPTGPDPFGNIPAERSFE